MIKNSISYIEVIRKHEKENDHLSNLNFYLEKDDSHLIKKYCEGSICLPTAILLRELQHKIEATTGKDYELNTLFKNCIKSSEKFYHSLEKLFDKNIVNSLDFDHEFSLIIQPIGQQIISLLKSIKVRIIIIKKTSNTLHHNQSKVDMNQLKSSLIIFSFKIYRYIYIIIYKLMIAQISNYERVKNFYYISALIASFFCLFIDFFIFKGIESPMKFAVFGVISVSGVLFTSILACPLTDFNQIDVHGKNLIAYRYRLLVNQTLNKKLLQILTLYVT